MEVNAFLVRLFLLLFPGVIGWKLYRKLRGRPVRQQWEDVLDIAIFSILAYSAAITSLSLATPSNVTSSFLLYSDATFSQIIDTKVAINGWIVLSATILSIFLAYIGSLAHSFGVVNRIGRLIHVTRHYGEEDVWQQIFDGVYNGEWLYIRDHQAGLLYYGYVEAYSDSEKSRELLLAEVSVYHNDNPGDAPLYCSKRMYISRNSNDLTIESPNFEKEPSTTSKESSHERQTPQAASTPTPAKSIRKHGKKRRRRR